MRAASNYADVSCSAPSLLLDHNAGMFTVLKNLSNLLAILGDYVFFGKTYGSAVWGCIGLMILSATAGGLTDLHFTAAGYAWQLVNCVFTSGYVFR